MMFPMVANLDGIIFDQIYGDNSDGAEFDSDGDGTTTQEDEFVSLHNTSGVPVDLSGWQIWSDSSGAGAPDSPQDGLYHTFPEGTVLGPGQTLYIINEITGEPAWYMQEASEGGVESGAGGASTNLLSEGDSAAFTESVALVNPDTGEYIIINLSGTQSSNIPGQSGFPGTTSVGESNAATESGTEDMNAGSSYRYNSTTDSYEYSAAEVTCFAKGTTISTPFGTSAIEDLKAGDEVLTLDRGAVPIRMVLKRSLDFRDGALDNQKPIEIKAGTLDRGIPLSGLAISPQHRVFVLMEDGSEALVPVKALTGRKGIRIQKGRRRVDYYHLVLDHHGILLANGIWCESFYPGRNSLSTLGPKARHHLHTIFPELAIGKRPTPARPFICMADARTLSPVPGWPGDLANAANLVA